MPGHFRRVDDRSLFPVSLRGSWRGDLRPRPAMGTRQRRTLMFKTSRHLEKQCG